MSASRSPAWRQQTSPERTGASMSIIERRGLDTLPSPRPPFSRSRSENPSPRSDRFAGLHTSASSISLQPPQSPAPSLTPSVASLTPSQAPSFAPSFTPSFAPSFTPSFTPSHDSRKGLFRRGHRPSTSVSPPGSISIPPERWQPSLPSTIVGGGEGQRRPGLAGRSVSDNLAPTTAGPKLQRKMSSASLLYQGLGRGLSRVGSVMRRGNHNSTPSADPTSSMSSRGSSSVGSATGKKETGTGRKPPKRSGSTTLQDLFEESEGVAADKAKESAPVQTPTRKRTIVRQRSAPLSTYVPNVQNDASSGVSRPFNVEHALHVTPELDGLPAEWIESLKSQGVTEKDLLLITSAQRRQRAVVRYPIVRTITPIDTSRPPSPTTPNTASTPSPSKTASTAVTTPNSNSKAATPPKKGSPLAQASAPAPVPAHTRTPAPPSSFNPASVSQLEVPTPTRSNSRGRKRSPTVTTPPPAMARRSLSMPSPDRGVTVKRSASLLGKLLDDIDSKSSRPSRRKPPVTETQASPPTTREEELPDVPGPAWSSTTQTDAQLQKRLSDELRGFHDISIPAEDGWAASILAAWDGDSVLAQELKGIAGPELARRLTQEARRQKERAPKPDPSTMPSSSTVLTPLAAPASEPASGSPSSAHTRLGKPRSASSLKIPSVDVDDVDDASIYARRRSKSFDEHIVDRSTLYSPPPPPPHPQLNTSKTGGDTPPTSFRSPHAGRLRASRDSFGVAHSAASVRNSFGTTPTSQTSFNHSHDGHARSDASPNSCINSTPGPSPSRSSSELNLGTPPSDTSRSGKVTSVESKIHERLSVTLATSSEKQRAATQTQSRPIVEVRHAIPEQAARDIPEAPSSVDLHSPPSTAASSCFFQHSQPSILDLPSPSYLLDTVPPPPPNGQLTPQEVDETDDFYDTYLGVGWCQACSIGAQGSALGLSLNTTPEHTCSLGGLGRHGSVRSVTSSYGGQDRGSVLSVGGASQLSRMSSVASSIHSYNLHEATVHRAYTRVLRRVPERSETYSSELEASEGHEGQSFNQSFETSVTHNSPGPSPVSPVEEDMSMTSANTDHWHSARQSVQSGTSAISALEDAAWRVAVREGCV